MQQQIGAFGERLEPRRDGGVARIDQAAPARLDAERHASEVRLGVLHLAGTPPPSLPFMGEAGRDLDHLRRRPGPRQRAAARHPNLAARLQLGARDEIVGQDAVGTEQLCGDGGDGLRAEHHPAVGEKGFAGALGRAGYETAFFGKAQFSTYHTFQPTGTPECLRSSAEYGADWYGPDMGFGHVELMLVGHNWFPPQKPPQGQHYERWFYADGRGDEKNALYRQNGGDTKGAAQTWHSKLPPAWHNSTWTAERAIERLRHGRRADEPFCSWVSFPDPHHPFDAPEPFSRLHDPAKVDLPEHRTLSFDGKPWWHEAVPTAEPTGSKESAEARKAYSRIPPRATGSCARYRQHLGPDRADRPQCRSYPHRAGGSRLRRRHRCRLHLGPWRLAGRPWADPEGAHAL